VKYSKRGSSISRLHGKTGIFTAREGCIIGEGRRGASGHEVHNKEVKGLAGGSALPSRSRRLTHGRLKQVPSCCAQPTRRGDLKEATSNRGRGNDGGKKKGKKYGGGLIHQGGGGGGKPTKRIRVKMINQKKYPKK